MKNNSTVPDIIKNINTTNEQFGPGAHVLEKMIIPSVVEDNALTKAERKVIHEKTDQF